MSFNNINSEKTVIKCGVPQGSIEGPLLFLIYIIDIANDSKVLLPIILADDTDIFLKGKSINDTLKKMNDEIIRIVKWLHANKLSLDIEMTHFMIFSSPRRSTARMRDVKINSIVIEYCELTEFIGVIIDSKLRLDQHVLMIRTKIARCVCILIRMQKTLTQSLLTTLYFSFIYPHYTIHILYRSVGKSSKYSYSVIH